MKYLTFIIAILTLNINVYAYECGYSNSFSSEQLQSMTAVANENVKDWVGKSVSKNGKEFHLEVLQNPYTKQYLVLVGEFHLKRYKASKKGKRLIDAFGYRLFELVPKRELTSDFSQKHYLQFSLISLTSARVYKSTIKEMFNKGLTIFPHHENAVSLDGYTISNFANRSMYTLPDVFDVYNTIATKTSVQFDYLNLPLEAGALLEFSEDDSYILDDRNDRMANSVVEYYQYFQKMDKAVAVVGANHLPGLIERLANSGFVLCENELQ